MENSAKRVLTSIEVKKGAIEITKKCSALTQVLKQFEGMYNTPMESCPGMTVEEWMSSMGVERFVTKGGKKKGYTPGTLRGGWHKDMLSKDGNLCLFRMRKAKYKEGKGAPMDVYTLKEAQKLGGKPIARYMLCEMGSDALWTTRMVMRGLEQSHNYEKEFETHLELECEYEEALGGELCVVILEEENGKLVRHIQKIDSKKVYF